MLNFALHSEAQAADSVVLIDGKPEVFAFVIAALGLKSALTIVLSTILSELTTLSGNFVILVIAMRYAHCKATPCIFTALLAKASFHLILCPLG